MPSQQTITIVKATAPILEEHGEALTRHFYTRLFANNPEVAPYFNSANQAGGRQQKALAAAITAYAANIDNLEVLGNAVELITQKHASLMIKPEHYPIVGENLLASIREVLGEAATDDIIAAWAEAYGFLAEIMIGREKQIYAENVARAGGWEGFKKFKVVRKQAESSNIVSFYLQPADGSAPPTFKPGQYITLRVPTPEGSTTMRNYSLSDASGQDSLRISVKREERGYVSNLLHNDIREGDTLDLGPPCGEFFLDITENHERPLVLLAAGIGVTPLFSILQTALVQMPGREIVFIHGCLTPDVQAFREPLEDLSKKYPNLRLHHRYNSGSLAIDAVTSTGMIDAELIEAFVPQRDADYFFCGPQPFMVGIYQELLKWGLPPAQIRFEFFGPREVLKAA
ncbi:NO-inducible flavohemoprotein [Caulobacter sp. DWR3-1-2]|uniref:NO-inducible flavohemoprotein n=1 Tax=Caulobacter sp. DWR3-1-2 TaxID=2804647 RepID=UPI003CFB27F6